MIKFLSIDNFQSHKKTRLDFCDGVNAIVGNSNSGKTSILRSLYWVLYNRPLGSSFISHWNIDDKENPVHNTSVIVKNDKGAIERRKGTIIQNEDKKDFNGYIINNDHILEAVGKGVPEEVTSLFNLEDVNIQKQLDSPFLLSESSGEVARFFNSLIKLDLIDNVLSKAESVRRETNKDLTRTEDEIIEINKELENFDWLDKAEKLIGRIQIMEEGIKEKNNLVEKINENLNKYREYEEKVKKIGIILSATSLVQNIDFLNNCIEKSKEKYNKLKKIIDTWKEQNKKLNEMEKLLNYEPLIKEIDILNSKIKEKNTLKTNLENSINKWIQYKQQKEELEKDIIKYTNMLPAICPLCNNPIGVKNV